MIKDEELDKIIKDKVKQVKTLDYTTDEIQSFMKKGKRRRYIKNIIKFTSVFVVIIFSCTILFFNNKINSDGEMRKNIISNKNEYSSKIVDTKYIDSFGTALTYRPNYDRRYIVKVEEIDKEELNGFYACVYVKASIIRVIEGEVKENINFTIDEAKVNILKYEEETKDLQTYSGYSDEEKEKNYIIVTNDFKLNNKSYPEINKTYIVSLYKNNEGELVVDNSAKYSFCEVDLDKNLVYIYNNWEQIKL